MMMDRGEDKVQVAHVLGNLGHGGAEMGVIRLIENFRDPRFAHRVVVLGSDLGLRESTGTSVPCYALGCQGRDYTAFMGLRRLFKEQLIDIVHVNNLGPWWDAALAARLAGCVCIETFHGIEQGRLRFSRPKRLLFKTAARLSSAVTAVAEPAARLVSELTGVDVNRIRVIPNGIDCKKYRPIEEPRQKNSLRRKLGLPEQAVLFGCVGALRPVKNHAGLIKAFAHAMSSDSMEVRLVLVGGGGLEGELKELCHTLGIADQVIFLGLRDDVPHVLQTLDGFVLNSDTEGLSYAVLEAMASGLPIIATKVGANPELVDNGVQGWLYDVGDTECLSSLIKRTAKEPGLLGECGARARQKVLSEYGLDTMVDVYTRLYEETISSSAASGWSLRGERS